MAYGCVHNLNSTPVTRGEVGYGVDDKQRENSPDSQKVFQRDEGAMTG